VHQNAQGLQTYHGDGQVAAADPLVKYYNSSFRERGTDDVIQELLPLLLIMLLTEVVMFPLQ